MEELDLLQKLGRVKAPLDFEQKVLSQLSIRQEKHVKARYLRFSLAGAFSVLAVLIIVVNLYILPERGQQGFSGLGKGLSSTIAERGDLFTQQETIPVIETLDYKGEVNTLNPVPLTIYILEQVSETVEPMIKY